MKYTNCYKFEAMKRVMIGLLVLSMIPANRISAQNPNLERLNAYKIAFFTRKLNLSSQEAEKFWPVYNEFQEKRNEIQLERISLNRDFNQNSFDMNEKELTEAGDKLISLQVDEANLAVEFHDMFKKILPPLKVLRLYQAENQYRMQLLNELQNKRSLPKN